MFKSPEPHWEEKKFKKYSAYLTNCVDYSAVDFDFFF